MEQRSRRELSPQPLDEFAGENPFLLRNRGEIPFRAVWIVQRDKGWLSAHRQAHIVLLEVGINSVAERLNAAPLLLRIRQRDARRLIDAFDAHVEREFAFTLINAACD